MTGSAKAERSRYTSWLLLWAAVVFMVWPLCATRYLPIEDLPQHLAAIRERFYFYVWDEETSEVRWMTAFDTTEEDVDGFIAALREIVR